MAITENKTENDFPCLSVTSVQVIPLSNKVGNILAIATVFLNNQLQISGLRIMDGENGLLVGYPANPFYKSASFRYSVLPITRALREHIEKCVLEKYKYEQEHPSVKFDVVLTHQDLSGTSLQMEIIASNEAEAQENAKAKATSIIPATKDNGEWTILKVVKHE